MGKEAILTDDDVKLGRKSPAEVCTARQLSRSNLSEIQDQSHKDGSISVLGTMVWFSAALPCGLPDSHKPARAVTMLISSLRTLP